MTCIRCLRTAGPTSFFFSRILLSAHLANLARELEEDVNIRRLATAHGLIAVTNKKSIYVEPSLFQARAVLYRKAHLLEHSDLYRISSPREFSVVREAIVRTEASLQVLDYLPPVHSQERISEQAGLRECPKCLADEWQRAYETAAREDLQEGPQRTCATGTYSPMHS